MLEADAIERDVQELLDAHVRRGAAPGISVALNLKGRRYAWAAGIAAADETRALVPDSRFQIGCITKLLTSIVALDLVEAGTLQLGAPIAHYLKELEAIPKAHVIEVKHLLAHTSGYLGLNIVDPGIAYYYSWRKFCDFFAQTAQNFQPGAVFSYEHSECAVLGEIVQRVTGETCAALFKKLLFDPLALDVGTVKLDAADTIRNVADHSYDAVNRRYIRLKSIPFGEFWASSLSAFTMTAADMLSLGEALMADASLRTPQRKLPFSSAVIRSARAQLVQVPVTHGTGQSERLPVSFGMGIAQYAGGEFGHNGSARGQTCGLRFDPLRDAAVVVGLNAWQPYLRDSLCSTILARYCDAVPPTRATAVTVAAFHTEDFIGSYVGGPGTTVNISRAGDALLCQILNQQGSPALKFALTVQPDGRLAFRSDLKHLSMGFFREPHADAPCLMIGMTAYKRVGS
jgi:CubicO group peptidase (beta-lactamase class C family)